MTPEIGEHEIHLYVDGQLAAERRAAVEHCLERDPGMAAEIQVYRRQNELLRKLYEPLTEAPLPEAHERLVRQLQRRLGRSRLTVAWPHAAAAAGLLAAAALGAGGTSVYDARNEPRPEPMSSFAETAVQVHSFYAGTPAEPTEFSADGAAKLNTLLDKRLGAQLPLPDLSQQGFSLVGGRLLPSPSGTAAQLLYRDKAGRLVTLFLGHAEDLRSSPAHPSAERQNLSLYTWLDGHMSFAVVGGLGGDELRGLAEAAQRSLQPPPPQQGGAGKSEEHPPAAPAPTKDRHGASPT
jgi:anti-sigma factor RsiW